MDLSKVSLPNSLSVTIKRSKARLSMRFVGSQTLQLSVPRFVPDFVVEKFVASHQSWIEATYHALQQKPSLSLGNHSLSDLKMKTRSLVRERLSYFQKFYGFQYARITIRDQSSRWGSCSSLKTLSFNVRLALLPGELSDYVIVHELCHLKHMDHSKRFWAEVSRTIPDYRSRRARLKQYQIEPV